MTKRIAILISGRGSNMETIVRNALDGSLRECCQVVLVLANRREAAGLEIARSLGIETAVVESRGRKRRAFDRELVATLGPYRPDYLVLAGFMRVLTSEIIDPYRNRIINIHPADTALYQGAHGYEWAFEQGLQTTKISVHYIDEGVDTGPVIAQREVDLRGAETIEEVEQRGLKVEHRFFSEVLKTLFEASSLQPPASSLGTGGA